jgi:site-specific recombinase XerD
MSNPNPLVQAYVSTLENKATGTQVGYSRALDTFIAWLHELTGESFQPDQFTKTAVETYFTYLEQRYSVSYRTLVKAALSGFANWLMDEDLLRRNPTRNLHIEAQPQLAPRILTDQQRFVLKQLVEQTDDRRAEVLFALGYYAGCRVSDVSWLRLEQVHLTERSGWIKVGHKGGKFREIDLAKPARQALHDYVQARVSDSPFVFPSQRAERLSEAGIHHWFRNLKAGAKAKDFKEIEAISYHDLRHDFAHRARAAGWTLEEIAYYLGHITKRGTPAIQTTARYTQVGREQVKSKLTWIRG